MPISVSCPECAANLTIPDEVIGKKIRCKNCSHAFRVEEPRAARPNEDDDDPRPVKKKVKARPVTEEDEDEPRPVKKGKKKASKSLFVPLLIVGLLAVLLLVGGLVVGIDYFAKTVDAPPEQFTPTPVNQVKDTRDFTEHVKLKIGPYLTEADGLANRQLGVTIEYELSNANKLTDTYAMVEKRGEGKETRMRIPPETLQKSNGKFVIRRYGSLNFELWIVREKSPGQYVRVSNIVEVGISILD